MTNSRDQILQTTCSLLEVQGFQATGLNEIVRESGAAKGSLYYYFPGGKEEIVAEAVRLAGRQTAERIRLHLSTIDDPAAALQSFVETIAYHVETSAFRSGGPLTTVASESATTSERINQACREAYQQLREAFAAKLRQSGMAAARADSLAWTINAAIEGAVILSRTDHSGEPLRQVARDVADLVRWNLGPARRPLPAGRSGRAGN